MCVFYQARQSHWQCSCISGSVCHQPIHQHFSLPLSPLWLTTRPSIPLYLPLTPSPAHLSLQSVHRRIFWFWMNSLTLMTPNYVCKWSRPTRCIHYNQGKCFFWQEMCSWWQSSASKNDLVTHDVKLQYGVWLPMKIRVAAQEDNASNLNFHLDATVLFYISSVHHFPVSAGIWMISTFS